MRQRAGVTVGPYPGGDFVSGYRWEDGIGPGGNRPRRLDLAWKAIETNAFGLDELMTGVRAAQVEPTMAVNLGTRGVREACDLLDCTNHPAGTPAVGPAPQERRRGSRAAERWSTGPTPLVDEFAQVSRRGMPAVKD